MGEVANPGEVSNTRKKKHNIGYPTTNEADSRSILTFEADCISRFRGANARMNQSSRNTPNRAATCLCRGCDQNWTSTHRQACPALGKKCNHCGLLNHFTKVCRNKMNNPKNSRQDTRISNVENSETTKKLESHNVTFINYNEQ